MFAVDDIDNTIARPRAHGAELLGEVAQYESTFRLCYLRGPAGVIVALAEQSADAILPHGACASARTRERERSPIVNSERRQGPG
jgi:hypothetical protein